MRRARLVSSLIVALLASSPSAFAQSTAATISGTVLDEQKSVLPGATVTIRNVETGQVRTATSDATGNYKLVGLPPGRYELVVELAGFTRSMQSDVILRIAQEITLHATLKLAGLQEAVTVTAETPIVETTKSSLGTTISTRTIEELPIAGRNFSTLAQLTPGITSTGGTGISSSGQLTRNNTFPDRRLEQRR